MSLQESPVVIETTGLSYFFQKSLGSFQALLTDLRTYLAM